MPKTVGSDFSRYFGFLHKTKQNDRWCECGCERPGVVQHCSLVPPSGRKLKWSCHRCSPSTALNRPWTPSSSTNRWSASHGWPTSPTSLERQYQNIYYVITSSTPKQLLILIHSLLTPPTPPPPPPSGCCRGNPTVSCIVSWGRTSACTLSSIQWRNSCRTATSRWSDRSGLRPIREVHGYYSKIWSSTDGI